MRKIVSLFACSALLLCAVPAAAADNFAVKDGTGAAITKRSKDVGAGVQADLNGLIDISNAQVDPATKQKQQEISDRVGDAVASPQANTLNDRLKTVAAKLDALLTALGTPEQAGTSKTVSNAAFFADCTVVSGDQAYTAGQQQHCTMTATGRVKVGLSSAASTGATAATISDLQGAVDPAGNQQPNKQDANANLQVANRASIFWNGATGSGSALTGSATYTGTARDIGYAAATYHQIPYFNAFFLTDQAGTARIDCSNDNSTWYTCATSAVVAATPLILTVPVMTRYHRAVLVNGSSAETYLWVNTSYTGA